MNIEAIDLFCGAGGLSYGLTKSGINIKAGIDFEPMCEFPFEQNIPNSKFIQHDISKLPSSMVESEYQQDTIRLLAGCAPCQPFSSLRNGTVRESSDKWPLLNHFARIVKDVKPDLVTMENVPTLRTQSIFNTFVNTLKEEGYEVCYKVVNAADYGVAQRRKRLVLLASKYGSIRLLAPSEIGLTPTTVFDAISSLPPIEAGGSCKTDPLHKARALNEINKKRIKASVPGGTWEDWPFELRALCHQKDTGSTFKSVYARMEWDKPSPTITTQASNYGTGRFGHPEQDRALSLREMAILQSFPKDYKFVKDDEEIQMNSTSKLIGNAVPVNLGYAIGMSFKHHINFHNTQKN